MTNDSVFNLNWSPTKADITKVEHHIDKPAKELKKVASYVKTIDGGLIFEKNLETGEVKKAEFMAADIFTIGAPNNKKILKKKGCIYCEALNYKNAVKRFNKLKT